MIIAVYVRKPALTAILLTLASYEQVAVAIIEEIVLRRFADNPADAWTTEIAYWVPTTLNTQIQAATAVDASTLTLDGDPVAVIRAEAADIILDTAQRYLTRRGASGTLALVPGISAAIKTAINDAPHDAPT
jgi:hypothetical protein